MFLKYSKKSCKKKPKQNKKKLFYNISTQNILKNNCFEFVGNYFLASQMEV